MNFSSDQILSLHALLTEQHDDPHEQVKNQHQPKILTSKTIIKDRSTINSEISSTSNSNQSKKEELLAKVDSTDQRIPPKYTFYFKNSIGTEDMFLGMNDITSASRDASHLVSCHVVVFISVLSLIFSKLYNFGMI